MQSVYFLILAHVDKFRESILELFLSYGIVLKLFNRFNLKLNFVANKVLAF